MSYKEHEDSNDNDLAKAMLLFIAVVSAGFFCMLLFVATVMS